jgi:hypothetical protein
MEREQSLTVPAFELHESTARHTGGVIGSDPPVRAA